VEATLATLSTGGIVAVGIVLVLLVGLFFTILRRAMRSSKS
jgi:hypothetical protein